MLVVCLEKGGVRMPGANCDRSNLLRHLDLKLWTLLIDLYLLDTAKNSRKNRVLVDVRRVKRNFVS